MLDFSRAKIWSIVGGLALLILFAVPSFVPEKYAPSWVARMPHINLGLDLAGGSYLMLEADTTKVASDKLKTMNSQVSQAMRTTKPRIDIGDISTANGRLSFMVRDPSKVDAARERILPLMVGPDGQTSVWTFSVINSSTIVLVPTEAGIKQEIERKMDDATENVRKRIDQLGTREPTIIRQGSDRIVVQVPGLKDPTQLKLLLGTTAKLEFKLVNTNADPNDVAKGLVPPDAMGRTTDVLKNAESGGTTPVYSDPIITGEMLIDAKSGFEQQTNMPEVTLQLDGAGTKRFAKTTIENTGKPFAIIVDDVVISAPRINEPILGGQARISGGFTSDSANQLAIALRAGKLPLPLKVIQESTVSPELGADSIHAGLTASAIAAVAVIIFMILTYGRFGIYATIAVVINVLVILAMMSLISATLTLPGIAGFVLTIGTAVDANVLINERIREERRRGRNVRQAIEFGYKEASRTIFEANVTHAIAGAIMLFMGYGGPIAGFAVVLLIGIATSVFTAVVFTRMLVSIWLRRNRPTEIHI